MLYILNNGQSLAARRTSKWSDNIMVRRAGQAPEPTTIPAIAYGFAQALISAGRATNVTILDTAKGGQSIDRYVKSNAAPELWLNVEGVWSEAGNPHVEAEIYVQGEADWGQGGAAEYVAKRKSVREELETLLGQRDFRTYSSVPYSGEDATVRAMRGDAWREIDHLLRKHTVIETMDLDADDGVHINEDDLVEIGRRMGVEHLRGETFLARPSSNRGVYVKSGVNYAVDMFVPQTVVANIDGGGTMSLPSASTCAGSMIFAHVRGAASIETRPDGANQNFGLTGAASGSSAALPPGDYLIAANGITRRWHVKTM